MAKIRQELTAEDTAHNLFIECYPNDLDNGQFIKKCWAKLYAQKICDRVIYETLTEYTNDENHERVVFWNKVKEEIENIK